jgi:hypothetical protein
MNESEKNALSDAIMALASLIDQRNSEIDKLRESFSLLCKLRDREMGKPIPRTK